MSGPAWMDKAHEFRENVNDGSMCLCGVLANYHDDVYDPENDERTHIGPWT